MKNSNKLNILSITSLIIQSIIVVITNILVIGLVILMAVGGLFIGGIAGLFTGEVLEVFKMALGMSVYMIIIIIAPIIITLIYDALHIPATVLTIKHKNKRASIILAIESIYTTIYMALMIIAALAITSDAQSEVTLIGIIISILIGGIVILNMIISIIGAIIQSTRKDEVKTNGYVQ